VGAGGSAAWEGEWVSDREGFEEAVDRVLRALRPGEVVTYGEVADEAGFPRRARAVGQLLAGSDGRYPWWRVVTSTGRLVPGHEVEHARRLRDEGHHVEHNRVVPPAADTASDRFDQAYFDRWYRDEGFGDRARLDRKVDHAIGTAEYLLERPIRSVLDLGCGEGAWQPAVKRRRPDATYVGVDPSRYAIERYGKRRNLHQARFGDFRRALDPAFGRYDLIVCIDVLGYVPDREVQLGLASVAALLDGVALIEVYTTDDDIVGDVDEFRRRRPSTYERWFATAGLQRVGPHLYVSERFAPTLATFEQPL
jgi:alkylated DNA nucleotide flippase Atl1/SAM-dependent methyltransferase